ncbi:hypothetical protein T03_16659 [Trichinella britovi]|uniref:Uncharacterized protein n=1 Tax=Trichinella britovi TaxID=45882 RepID=A0A0V1C3N8_TRIBR|nr:hypothetical protein T03_16659 [Trichinella britovi]
MVIRNGEWAWRDRSKAGMLAGSMEVNKIRHTGSLRWSQERDNQISFVLNRGPEVAEDSNGGIESRADCWYDSCESR